MNSQFKGLNNKLILIAIPSSLVILTYDRAQGVRSVITNNEKYRNANMYSSSRTRPKQTQINNKLSE